MTATTVVKVAWGTSGVSTPGTVSTIGTATGAELRLKTAEDITVDTNNPIPIPATGDNYSYWRSVFLYASTAPDTNINNVKFYADGTVFGSDVVLNVGDETPATYRPASGAPGNEPGLEREVVRRLFSYHHIAEKMFGCDTAWDWYKENKRSEHENQADRVS